VRAIFFRERLICCGERGDVFTYHNLIRLSAVRGSPLYLLHRSVGLYPNYLLSDEDGRTWRAGYSPYTKYISNKRDSDISSLGLVEISV
jgi:hypothetical protein